MCLAGLAEEEPRIAVRAAPSLHARLLADLGPGRGRLRLRGPPAVLADASVSPGDCVVDWRSGIRREPAGDVAGKSTGLSRRRRAWRCCRHRSRTS